METDRLNKLRAINIELLENVVHIMHQVDCYCKEHMIPLMMDDSLMYLVQNAIRLIHEMNEEYALPPNMKLNFIRRKVTDEKSDDKVPVPHTKFPIFWKPYLVKNL